MPLRRPTLYAGSWYEADQSKLSLQLNQYIDSAAHDVGINSADIKSEPLLAVIAPHAGYIFSGRTAAYSYELAKGRGIKRIFLLGPSHHVSLFGAALPTASKFATPLGDLEVDTDTIEQLASYPMFSTNAEVHTVEHSLELQLPFIKQIFGAAKIVPIVIGQLADESEIRLVAEILKGYVTEHDLVVVSSDFTHYGPRFEYVPFTENVRQNIDQLDMEAFKHLANADVSQLIEFVRRTRATICGIYPCAVLRAMLPVNSHTTLLNYTTSQDAMPDDADHSVSYLAVAFSGASWPANPGSRKPVNEVINLDSTEKNALLTIARKTIAEWTTSRNVLDPAKLDVALTARLKEPFGAFVTLYNRNHKRSDGRELRGCIGSIWPTRPLYKTVMDNALGASSRDPRFDPITASELNDLIIEISVLTPPRRVASFKDIIIGTDGVILSKGNKQSVFLPQVATEYGWDLDETLKQLCIKAGLNENEWRSDAKFDVFQSLSIS